MEFLAGAVETIINFFKAIWDAFQKLFDWLGDAYDAFVDFLLNLPEWIFSKLAAAIVELWEKIPVPDFFGTAQQTFANVPPEVIYFASAFQLGYGITLVLGAYLLRFIVRRLPFVG